MEEKEKADRNEIRARRKTVGFAVI